MMEHLLILRTRECCGAIAVLLAAMMCATPTNAQTLKVGGQVNSDTGEPLVGVVVNVKGTPTATSTDIKGIFTVDVPAPPRDVLEIRLLGYEPQEVKIAGRAWIEVTMRPDAQSMETVVVTALGIRRAEKALSYNVQTVAGDELATVRSGNFVGSLAGKVAGVQVNPASGPGGGVRVVARGNKSLDGNNNVLYVVDGVPMRNTSPKVDAAATTMSAQQGSEAIADINPDDIASLTMLTGPAAAALYGSEGANGVILITTRRGGGDRATVTFSNNTTFSSPLLLPEFQNRYGNAAGSYESWGDKTGRRYDPADFLRTGHNVSTGVAVQSGAGRHQTYFSAANTSSAGVIPNNTYNRNNFSGRYTTAFFDDKLTLDLSAGFIAQKDANGVSQGNYFSPLPAVWLFPRGEDFDAVREFERWDAPRELMMQNWKYGDLGVNAQNPYWIQRRMLRDNNKKRYMYTATVKYDIAKGLDLTGRVNMDAADHRNTYRWHAGTSGIFANENKGAYKLTLRHESQTYTDLIANLNRTFGEWSLFVNAGGSVKDTRWRENTAEGKLSDSAPANWFEVEALDRDNVKYRTDGFRHLRQSLFVNAEVGYRGAFYLTLTGRGDWDSSLAYKGHARGRDVSFFYPSVGASVIFSQLFEMPRGWDFAKLRFARTEVGNGIEPHRAYADDEKYYIYNDQTHQWSMDTRLGYVDPKPERTVSYEVGVDLRFMGGALTLDATGYTSNTYNQTYVKQLQGGVSRWSQAGNVRNTGAEVTLGFHKKWGDFGWWSGLTWSYNRNKVVDMEFADRGHTNMMLLGDNTVVRITKGGSMRDLYIKKYDWMRTENGGLYINPNTGAPVLAGVSDDSIEGWEKVGGMDARSYAGWSNTFSYKGFDLGVQLRGRFGGLVVSNTEAMLDRYGVSRKSAALRDQGGVTIHGTNVSAQNYLGQITLGNGRGRHYIYSATNVRLGELSLSYNLPRRWFRDVVSMSVGVVASNVAILYNKAPFDPEQATSAGDTYYNGVDYFMAPSTRTVGFSVKLQF